MESKSFPIWITTLIHLFMFSIIYLVFRNNSNISYNQGCNWLQICQFLIWYADLLACQDKRLIDQASDVPSIILFSLFLIELRHSKLFISNIKWIETIFENDLSIEIVKQIIRGTSDAWSMSPFSWHPSKAAYYIEDWQILPQIG